MASIQKHKFRTVEVDREDLEKKLRAHRRKVAILVILVLILLSAAAILTYVYYENKVYTSYHVLSTIERSDTSASNFTTFQGKVLRYTNDGAVYTDADGALIWNQTYEMDQPIVEKRGNYVVIYELNGTQIYILDTINLQGSIQTTTPIQRVSIAAQGTVAVLTEEGGTSYLQLFDKTGVALASGELHVQNSGYPLDLTLSENGEKLAVSMLDIHDGKVKTVIAFYNFGAVGQNAIDKIVSSYTYADVVIPEIRYFADDTMVAFGDDRLILFTGEQKPAETKQIELQKEIKSIFFDEMGERQFGLIYDESEKKNHRLELYQISGEKTLEVSFETDYTDVEILANGELCIMGEEGCEIYNQKGMCKFQYDFRSHLYEVLSGRIQTEYTVLLESETINIKLK